MGGDECPNCGGPLREIADVREGPKRDGETSPAPVPVELDWTAPATVDEALPPRSAPPTLAQPLPDGVSGGGQRGVRWRITLNGKTQGVTAWARELGLDASVILARLYAKCSAQEALAPMQQCELPCDHNYPLTFGGETLTAAQWAERIHLPVNTLLWRLKRRWPIERVLRATSSAPSKGDPAHRRGPKESLVEFQGEQLTVFEWSVRTGLRENTIRMRLKRGWSIDDTLTKPEVVVRAPAPLFASAPADSCILAAPAPPAPPTPSIEHGLIARIREQLRKIDEIDAEIALLRTKRDAAIEGFKAIVKG